MRHICLGTAVFLALACATAADNRRSDPMRLVVMTLNAEFLWDGVAPEEGQVEFPWKGSPDEAGEHMRLVAEIVRRVDPDIVNLVEVENLDGLRKFNDEFLEGRGYRPYLIDGKDTYTEQEECLLTRIDPEGDAIARDDREGRSGSVRKSVSKNYVARLHIGSLKLGVVGVHLLAQPNRQDRRAARGPGGRRPRNGKGSPTAGYLPIVLGDFNDYDGADDARDHVDSLPITNVLASIRAMDPATPADDLWNAAALAPKAIRYTAFWDQDDDGQVDSPRELTSIDHVRLSPELRSGAATVEAVEFPHDHDPRHVTDHFPVVVRLRVGGVAPATTLTATMRIVRLLPNPVGDERENEEATVRNTGATAASLVGWKLRDLAGKTWALDALGTLAPGEEKTIRRDGQPMAMNNSGDTVELLDAAGAVMQSVTYGSVAKGEEVRPAP